MTERIINLDSNKKERFPAVDTYVWEISKPDNFYRNDLERMVVAMTATFNVYKFEGDINERDKLVMKISRLDGQLIINPPYLVQKIWRAMLRGWVIRGEK